MHRNVGGWVKKLWLWLPVKGIDSTLNREAISITAALLTSINQSHTYIHYRHSTCSVNTHIQINFLSRLFTKDKAKILLYCWSMSYKPVLTSLLRLLYVFFPIYSRYYISHLLYSDCMMVSAMFLRDIMHQVERWRWGLYPRTCTV